MDSQQNALKPNGPAAAATPPGKQGSAGDRQLIKLKISRLDDLLDQTRHGLLLPQESSPHDRGSCNIVIRGRPGTGKSTLALQIARAICVPGKAPACAEGKRQDESGPNYFSVYAPLENPPDAIIDHAAEFGWQDDLSAVECLQNLDETPSQTRLGEALCRILRGCSNKCELTVRDGSKCKAQDGQSDTSTPRRVLIPRLSPRSVRVDPDKPDELFWRRYSEIERILEAGTWLAEHRSDLPKLKLIVVDSLNVFADRPLGREDLFRLFDLCARHRVVGVFVVEVRESDEDRGAALLNYNTVEYLADIVIGLQAHEVYGYQLQTIQVVKSRYQNHSHEEHPFKLFPRLSARDAEYVAARDGFVIYPSVHMVMREIRLEAGK